MNPSIRPASLERERRLDPDRFAREYEANFTEDLETFLPGAWIDAAITPGRHELPPRDGVRYEAAVDPSGGGQDAFTLVIAHAEGSGSDRRIAQDVMRGWASRRSETTDLEGWSGRSLAPSSGTACRPSWAIATRRDGFASDSRPRASATGTPRPTRPRFTSKSSPSSPKGGSKSWITRPSRASSSSWSAAPPGGPHPRRPSPRGPRRLRERAGPGRGGRDAR
jgi:hypothetical protein